MDAIASEGFLTHCHDSCKNKSIVSYSIY